MVAMQLADRRLLPALEAILQEQGVRLPSPDFGYGNDARGLLLNQMMRLRAALSGRYDIEANLVARLGSTPASASLSPDDKQAVRALLHAYATKDEYYLNYYGPTETVPFVSADDVISGRVSSLSGWTAFVGSSVGSDSYPTPYTRGLADNMPGVEITTTAFANLRSRTTIAPLSEPWSLAVIAAMGLLVGTLSRALRPVVVAGANAAIALAYFTGTYWIFTRGLILLPLITPMVVQLVPALIVGIMIRTLGPPSRTFLGVCLQTDIKGSMDLARRPRFKRELKRYFRDVGRIVGSCRGTLVRASDDSTISYWRDRPNRVRDRERACLAALALRQHFCDPGNLDTGQFPTRIGLHTGSVTVSGVAIGEARVANVTGDVANTAARLQELCKLLGTWVLASAEAVEGVKCVEFRRIGRFLLVGRDQPVEVMELLGEQGRVNDDILAQRKSFSSIATLLELGDRAQAAKALRRHCHTFPEDQVARFFLVLVQRDIDGIASSLEAGVIRVTSK
jgi:adenylate cyclase